MDTRFRAKNIEISDKTKRYAKEKLTHLKRYFDQIFHAEVEFILEKNPSIANNKTVEVTLSARGQTIRAKESSTDIYASIDLVIDKLERQIKRHKDKLYSSSRRNNQHAPQLNQNSTESSKAIVKLKQIDMKPMTPEEATMQMDLLGHDFFVFTNSETEEINVVYKRRDNNYGLIEPI